MITDNPRHGDIIIEEGRATPWFQSFLDSIVFSINQNRDEIFTVATVPDATKNRGRTIQVSDEVGGETKAFSDGTNWRRVQDRAIIS